MEVISIERSTYEELLTSFNSFVTKMKEMASRGNDKRLGDWLDNQGRVMGTSALDPVQSITQWVKCLSMTLGGIRKK